MKKVVSKTEVAKLWANQNQHEARVQNGNFYFDSTVIYSYGSHFPIAKIKENNICLFTLQGYSNSTAKHINEVRYAANRANLNIIYCYDIFNTEKSLQYFTNQIKKLIAEIRNPKNRKFEGRLADLRHYANQLLTYVKYFKIDLSFEDSTLMHFVQSENILTQLR
jgi:hypothetical protein